MPFSFSSCFHGLFSLSVDEEPFTSFGIVHGFSLFRLVHCTHPTTVGLNYERSINSAVNGCGNKTLADIRLSRFVNPSPSLTQ